MKYIKLLEEIDQTYYKIYAEESFKYLKGNHHKNFKEDLIRIKKRKIDYKIYYTFADNIGNIFMIIVNNILSNKDSNLMSRLKFELHRFTIGNLWKEINEDEADAIISSSKYNL